MLYLARRIIRYALGIPVKSVYFLRTDYWHNGERVNPDFADSNFRSHLKAYKFISQMVVGKAVLDVGCGTGYGTDVLAQQAAEVTGIDYAPAAIRFAKKRYRTPRFLVMNAQSLAFRDAAFDFVFSSENFEHLPDQPAHLREVRRVLKPGGICFIATPNPEILAGQGGNRWHLKENTYEELVELFRPIFNEVVIFETVVCRKSNRGVIPADPLVVLGQKLNTEHLANDLSFYCFLR